MAWQTFQDSGADALLSVVPFRHVVQSAMTQTKAGWVQPLFPADYELSRHALVPTYRHDGGHAIADIDRFLETQAFLGPRTVAFPVPKEEVVDIDEPIDLLWAEFLLEKGMVK